MAAAVMSQTAVQSTVTFRAVSRQAAAPRACLRLVSSPPQKVSGQRRGLIAKAGADTVSSSYAGALVDLAVAKDALEEVHADVDALSTLFKESTDLKEFLYNPLIDDKKKKALLGKVASEAGLQQYTVNFLSVLLDQKRVEEMDNIFLAFEDEYCKLTDTQVAVVRSAVKLEQEQQFLIAKKLQELTGSKNIKLKPVIDETLIGGFIVEYGSSQIDLSIKGQVDQIASELLAVKV